MAIKGVRILRFLRQYPLAVLLLLYLAVQSFFGGQMRDPMGWVMSKLMILPAILIGLSFHEFAHAFAADRLGDRTPRMQGRVTINPAAHIDPFGLLALFFIGFGWGKRVMVGERNFKHPRRDGIIVDLAGVTTNFILALAFAYIIRLLSVYQTDFMNSSVGFILLQMLLNVISINIVLMIFNLLPIPPLDGFGILTEVFNLREKDWYYKVYSNGFIILLALIVFDVTGMILVPAVNYVYGIVMNIVF
jgi:Zn-dependent protease